MAELTFSDVSRVLQADFETGKLFWRHRTPDMFPCDSNPESQCASWNTKYAGKPAFTANSHGYRAGTIFDRMHLAHRVLWLLHTGFWPEEDIDHVNGNRSDNRIENLRSVPHVENQKNMCRGIRNKSGVVGVCWCGQINRWRANIRVAGSLMHLGYFAVFDDAVSVRKAAEVQYGFHVNHGKAAA